MNKSSSKNLFLRFKFFALLHLLVAAYKGALEPSQTSTVKLFLLNYLTIFAKKAPSQMFDWVEKFEILISLLFPVYVVSRKKTLLENVYDIAFEKMKGRGGMERVFMQKEPSRNFVKFTRKHLCLKDSSAGVSLWILRNL